MMHMCVTEMESWGLAAHDVYFSCAMSFLFRPTLRLRVALAPMQRAVQGKHSQKGPLSRLCVENVLGH